jgi:hypothetical protein
MKMNGRVMGIGLVLEQEPQKILNFHLLRKPEKLFGPINLTVAKNTREIVNL